MRFMKRVIKAVQSHRRTAGFVLAGLIFIVGGVFVLPKLINADGALVNSFGLNGVVTSNPSSALDAIAALAIDSNYLYTVGYQENIVDGWREWRIEKRRLDTGALCDAAACGTEFGTGGAVVSNPSVRHDSAADIVIDTAGGYMYVGGYYDAGAYSWEWRIEKRYLSNGALVGSFGSGGAVVTQISTRTEEVTGLALDAAGLYLYVSGIDQTANLNGRLRIEKRRADTGALCTVAACGTEFGTGGVKIDAPTGVDNLYDIALDATGIYAIGGEKPVRVQWRIEKRNLDTGALIWNQSSSPSFNANNDEYGQVIALDASGIYVSGRARGGSLGGLQWRIEKRNLTDGSLISSFGTAGVVTADYSSGSDWINDFALDSNSIYVVGADNSPGNSQWRIEKRNLTDGSLNWAQTSNPSSDQLEPAVSAVLDSTGNLFVAGGDRSAGTGQWRIEKRRTAAPVTAPAVTTQSAGSVGDSGAVLNGLANPNNGATTGWFRYDAAPPGSCNDTFGTRLPLSGGTSLGSGSSNVSFFQTVGGLNSSATYYFCAIAENSAGKSYGSILSFATTAPGAVSSYGVTREGCELKNWGWGSEVTGWVSFNSTNNYGGKTPGSNYGATLANFCENLAPNAPGNLAVTDTSSANWSFNCVSPLQPAFSWTFSDPNTDDYQSAFQLQVDDNSDFSSPEYDSGSATTTSFTTSVPAGRLSYNTTYNWRVKTWDNRKTPLVSPWATGTPFATTAHAWPSPDFTFLPNSPSVGQDTLFRRDQDSDGDTFGTRCFDSGNNVVACGNYYWTMEDTSPTMSETASSSIPVIVSFNSPGRKEINLKATDAEGFYCLKSRSTGTVTLPLPQYKEVLPR